MAINQTGLFYAASGAVIVNNDNKILLTQRSFERDHHPGEWEVTTGRLAQGESFEEALHREIQEELHIAVAIIAPLQTFHFYRGKEKLEHVGVVFLCRYLSGELIVDGVEEIAYQWVSIEEAFHIVNDESIKGNIKKAREYLEKNRI